MLRWAADSWGLMLGKGGAKDVFCLDRSRSLELAF